MDKKFKHQSIVKFEKKISEIYLGYSEFYWEYSIANYSATCTEAIDFTLFDKTICALLEVEDYLSFEQIGEILGFNVVEGLGNKKYKDIAEVEILMDALQHLYDFGMIEIGVVNFSMCSLTPIGEEYTALKKKFKTTHNQKFKLLFDKTKGIHNEAKKVFEFLPRDKTSLRNSFITIDGSKEEAEINYEDEDFLKEFAEDQIPDIYNPAKMNSFKNLKLESVDECIIRIEAIFLLDINTGKRRCFACVKDSINSYFTKFLNNNVEFETQLFHQLLPKLTIQDSKNGKTFPDSFLEELIELEENLDSLLKDDKAKAIKAVNNFIINSDVNQYGVFIQNLSQILRGADNEIWVMLDSLTDKAIDELNTLISLNEKENRFLFLILTENENYKEKLDALTKKAKQTKNTYLILKEEVDDFYVVAYNNKNCVDYKLDNFVVPITIDTKTQGCTLPFVEKEEIERDVINKDFLSNYRDEFADEFAHSIYDIVLSKIQQLDIKKDNGIKALNKLQNIDNKLVPFRKCSNFKGIIKDVEDVKKTALQKMLELRKEAIQTNMKAINEKIKTTSDLAILEQINNKLRSFKSDASQKEYYLFKKNEDLISNKIRDAKLIAEKQTIIIDTNILIEEPDIIRKIGTEEFIVFSGQVIEELDKLKHKSQTKTRAQQAIRNIRKNQSQDNIKFNFGKTHLLPDDFDKKSPDNKILSVAVGYKKRNPILLSNDNNMGIKSKMLDIPCMSLNELYELLIKKKGGKEGKDPQKNHKNNKNSNKRRNNKNRYFKNRKNKK